MGHQGFGLLFAFDTDLDWMDIVDEVEQFAKSNPKSLWSNAVFVLSKGFIIHGDDQSGKLFNEDLQKISTLQIHGRPDRDGLCLYNFYTALLELLGNTELQRPPINSYLRLPLVAGEHSYEFSFGHFVEYGVCDRHGDFSRKLTADKLVDVINWCMGAEPINWVRATELAYGLPGDNVAAYIRQPRNVRIYNPEAFPLSEILVMDKTVEHDENQTKIKVNAFDGIRTAGMEIWIPYYYEVKEKLINLCPKCEKEGRFDD